MKFFSRRGRASRGEVFYHGTSPAAVSSILRSGLRGSRKPDTFSLRGALSIWELAARTGEAPWVDAFGVENEEWYNNFMEAAGVPMRGYVYLARDPGDVMTRGEDSAGRAYMLKVVATGPVLPDEDWLGRELLEVAAGAGSEQVIQCMFQALPDRVKRDIRAVLREHHTDWEWCALVAKAAIPALKRTPRGKRMLRVAGKLAPTVAHQGSPRVVEVLRRQEYETQRGQWLDVGYRWEPVPAGETPR